MAAHCRLLGTSMILLFFVGFVDVVVVSQSMPDERTVKIWANNLSKTLRGDFNLTSGYEIFMDAYNNRRNQYQILDVFSLKFEKINPDALVEEMTKKLSEMLESKTQALNRSVKVAEDAAKAHHWKPKLKKEDVTYVSAKELKTNDSRLIFHERFKQKVITNMTSVHIPVEIYDGDVEILNGLEWSAALDKIFSENYEKDPEILWQYFGSQTGFMRTLPAGIWKKKKNEVDLFDVRRRPWYTQGSSSPKDMMIIIDTSGSVHGQALELIKVSVKSLLDTLGENDFVNIATFSKSAQFVTNCFNGSFVQANYRNKKKLIEAVEDIEAGGMANFQLGLEFAFEQLERLKNESDGSRGAGCNRMIMLLTDGGTDHAEEVFDKYNPKGNKTYRVFTYAVGPTANPVTAIRWMSCRNRGYFSQIPAMGAIRSKVQEYMVKPNPALVIPYQTLEERVHYTVQYNTAGLGMMTTVTLPVYDRTEGSSNQTILGVMGIDVTTAEMLKHAPHRKLGPNGFPYAINSNGYMVFHPSLRIHDDVKDPPNVDFLEVEVDSEGKEQLRTNMIDLKTGSVSLDTYTISMDQRHVDRERGDRQRYYSYRSISKTSFSLGMSVPAYHQHHLVVTADIPLLMKKEKALLNASNTALLIADWEYYVNFTKNANHTGTILDLKAALEHLTNYKWNFESIYHLLWDLSITSYFDDYWINVKKKNESKGMVGCFVGTVGGLTRIYPKSCRYKHIATRGSCKAWDYTDTKCAIKCVNVSASGDLVRSFENERDTWKATYFKRSIDSSDLMFSAPYVLKMNNESVGHITMFKSVVIDNPSLDPTFTGNKLSYKPAVVGSVFTHESIRDRMVAATQDGVDKLMTINTCEDHGVLACYLLDDGAFLIATNQNHLNTSVGMFFGHVDKEIMRELYNRSIYSRLEQYDYQATCNASTSGEQVSAGNLNIPSLTLLYEMLTFNWWSSVATWTFTNLNLYNLMFSSAAPKAEAYVLPDKTRPCIKKQAQYYFAENAGFMSGQTECEIKLLNCSREFIAVQLNGTNLLMVLAEVEKKDCEQCKLLIDPEELIQEPTESEPDFCNSKSRYRRPTYTCSDFDVREDDTKCAASLTHPVSYVAIAIVTLASMLLSMR